ICTCPRPSLVGELCVPVNVGVPVATVLSCSGLVIVGAVGGREYNICASNLVTTTPAKLSLGMPVPGRKRPVICTDDGFSTGVWLNVPLTAWYVDDTPRVVGVPIPSTESRSAFRNDAPSKLSPEYPRAVAFRVNP